MKNYILTLHDTIHYTFKIGFSLKEIFFLNFSLIFLYFYKKTMFKCLINFYTKLLWIY